MSEERNQPASERQRQKFRERGEVARSRELTMIGTLLAGGAAVVATARTAQSGFLPYFANRLNNLDRSLSAEVARETMSAFAAATVPTFGACLVAAVGVGLLQTRGLVSMTSLEVDWNRLNPLPRLLQLFGSVESLLGVAMSVLRVGVVVAITWGVLADRVPSLVGLDHASTATSWQLAAELILAIAGRSAFALVVLGLVDFGIQHWRMEKRMRMSPDEARQEMKEEAGDPQIRSARRRRARELVKSRSLRGVAQADVVVVNPTHYAVALAYKSDKMRAPKVVAKGVDRVAELIRAAARQRSVPIIPQPPLARLLYKRVRVGREVPADLYQAVAVVLAQIYRHRGRSA